MGPSKRAHWSSRLAFILAAAGSAIGLGNLWKFPYIAGANGGGAFVLVYLACIFAVGIPIFIAELYIGQTAQKNAVGAFEVVHKKGTPWRHIGSLGVLSAFLILSFYSVVGGWVLDFEFRSILNQFGTQSDESIKAMMGTLFSDPVRQLMWHTIFMGLTVGIVYGGIKDGIEKWNKILMPALLGILGLLLVNSFFQPGFAQAFSFIFSPDASKLTAEGVLSAVGQSFFTLSLGMGAIITYGSYLASKEQLVKTAISVALLDTGIAILSGVVIFTVVFTYGVEPGAGPTLMFQTLPMLFGKMTGGYFISIAFFALVTFAALTSAVSLLEVVVTYLVERHKKKRSQATIMAGVVVYFLGYLAALSTNILSTPVFLKFTFFDLFDRLTSDVFLPVGGMFISLFFGWHLGPKAVKVVVGKGPLSDVMCLGLLWTARVIAPAAIIWVLYNGLSSW